MAVQRLCFIIFILLECYVDIVKAFHSSIPI
nr:MAG TPA: hypothetical protein [Caudoviricetes sp.]